MSLKQLRNALGSAYDDIVRNHTLQMAAALSYYFVMSLFPCLILLSAIVAFLPIPNMFDQAIRLMSQFVPADSMMLVKKILSDVISPNRGAFLSIGIIGTLWTASGGFSSAIEALNFAYDVEETRPFWRTRLLAVGLTFLLGFLLLTAVVVMIVGPHLAGWLVARLHLPQELRVIWPVIHWTVAIAFTVLAVEFLYFLGPNVKQRFGWTLPGAILAVGCWLLMTYALGFYFRSFAHLNKTYGVLGAGIGLMMWLYWTWFAMLVGGELNAELAKRSESGPIEQQEPSAEPLAPAA